MNTPNPNEFDKSNWIAQARQLLDESADGLDAATLSRLNRARQAALATRTRKKSQFWMLPAGLAGTCALLFAAAVWMPRHGVVGAPSPHTDVGAVASEAKEAGDALAADDSPEFYQDLDFYAWLDAQHKDGTG